MKQVIQHLNTGETIIAEVPAPACGRGMVKIRTHRTLISAGTERMLVEFSKSGLLAKAKAQPDKVKQVLEKIRTDGVLPTLDRVFKRLNEPLPLGYCNAGEVMEVGDGVTEFQKGDRVASAGRHAEVVCVPKHLCARIPDGVSDEDAAFTVLASIALQGIRLVQPALGERIVVFGAGLIGLVTIQLLRANGCEVLAIDLDAQRLALARTFGAQPCHATTSDPITMAQTWSKGAGVDAVLITASAKTDLIVQQAAEMCRKRGRIVLVGVVGLNLRRSDFYKKELSFQVSCSYGPGRYDDDYEQKGIDYPAGYVRWTEQRNFEAVLSAMAAGNLRLSTMVTDRFALADAKTAYDNVSANPLTLGVLLEYDESEEAPAQTIRVTAASSRPAKGCVAALVGAGNFAKMTLAPALKRSEAQLKYVVGKANSVAAKDVAEKYGAEHATTDLGAVLADKAVNTVFIATRHNSHAALVCEALAAGKHVFVEKPLALNIRELSRVMRTTREHPGQQVMVGFNRRFSPHVVKMKALLTGRAEALAMRIGVNAGIIPPDVWVHDPEVGGGRIIGEACHFVDLLSFLCGAPVMTVSSACVGRDVATPGDKMSIQMTFEDGSIGTVDYFGNGSKVYPKETVEVFSEGRVLRLDNFKALRGYGFAGFRKFTTFRQDKGHVAEVAAYAARVRQGGESLIPLAELVNVTLASFAAVTSANERRVIEIATEYAPVLTDRLLPSDQ